MSNANAWNAPRPRRNTPALRAALPAPGCSRPPSRVQVLALAVASALSMLTGCASGLPPVVANYPTPPARMTTVDPLPPAAPDSGRTEDLLENHARWANALHRSRQNHESLIRWLDAVRNATRQ